VSPRCNFNALNTSHPFRARTLLFSVCVPSQSVGFLFFLSFFIFFYHLLICSCSSVWPHIIRVWNELRFLVSSNQTEGNTQLLMQIACRSFFSSPSSQHFQNKETKSFHCWRNKSCLAETRTTTFSLDVNSQLSSGGCSPQKGSV